MKMGVSVIRKRKNPLELEVGDLAEAKTFEEGYRGAWFRCKIKRVIRSKGRIIAYIVDYYDYTEDSEETKVLFEAPKEKESVTGQRPKKQLMMRPQFPPFYCQTKLPDLNTISQVIIAVADDYAVGDLVDWFAEGCYWSGTLTKLVDNDRFKITLLEPPRGEGSSYVVRRKDLRPSLDWSPESGWTVPSSLECKSGRLLARVIQPMEQDEMDEEKEKMKVTPRPSLELNQSMSSHTSVGSLPLDRSKSQSEDSLHLSEKFSKKRMLEKHKLNAELDVGGSTLGKPSCSDSVSSTYVREVQATFDNDNNKSAKKSRLSNETMSLNITSCDCIESAILDLEELVNRVKWMKHILKFGISSKLEDPTWKCLQHPSLSTPK